MSTIKDTDKQLKAVNYEITLDKNDLTDYVVHNMETPWHLQPQNGNGAQLSTEQMYVSDFQRTEWIDLDHYCLAATGTQISILID